MRCGRLASVCVILQLVFACLAAPPARADLVGWWPFDEDVDDYSGNDNHGFILDAVFDGDIPPAIDDGASLSFDGAQGVEIPGNEVLDSPVFTLSMFVLDRGQSLPFARVTSRGSDTFETSIGTGGAGDEIKYYSPANGWNTSSHVTLIEGWQHIAFVADGVTLTIYVDGEVVYGPVPFQAAPTGVLHIGNRWNGVEGFYGLIDDVALFDEPLDSDEVLALADTGTAVFLETYVPNEHPPTPPIGVRAFAGDGQVEFAWDPVEGADGYNVYRGGVSGGPYDLLTTEPLTDPAYTDTDVVNGTEYYYVLTSVNESGESSTSLEVVVVPRPPLEDPAEVLVGWWPFDEDLDDYSVWRNDGIEVGLPLFDSDVPDAIADGTSLALDGISGVEIAGNQSLDSEIFTLSMFVRDPGQSLPFARLTSRGNDVIETAIGTGGAGDEYKFFSRAVGAWNTSGYTVPLDTWQHLAYVADGHQLTVYVDGEIVYGPAPFTSAPSGIFRIGIRWNGVEGFVGFLDDVALFSAALTQDQIQTIASSGTKGLVGELGEPRPLPPANVLATADNGAVEISWDPAEGADGYNLYRGTTAGGPYDLVNTELLTSTEYTDTDIVSFTRYYYVVSSVNASGEGRTSTETSAYPIEEFEDPADAIAGWWPLDEDLEDHSGNGLHGIYTGGDPVYDTDVPEGIGAGAALVVDGSAGVEVAADSLLDAEIFTLSYFVRTSGQAANFSRITSRGSDTFETAAGPGFETDEARYYSPANGWNETGMPLAFETWEHVAYVADGTTLTIYLNGEPYLGPVDFVARPTGVFHIGNRWNNSEGFIGGIDDVALFRGALDADSIAVLAEQGAAGLLGESPGGARFIRADSNGDGGINLTDAIYTLGYLFLGGEKPKCLAAADANGDGNVNIADAQYSLSYNFLGGPQPPAPFPSCGPGNAGDAELGCETTPANCQ